MWKPRRPTPPPHTAVPLDAACPELVAQLRNEASFTPPSLKGSLVVPVNHLRPMIRLIPPVEFAEKKVRGVEMTAQKGSANGMTRPCVKSPWGSLVAMDTRTGDI